MFPRGANGAQRIAQACSAASRAEDISLGDRTEIPGNTRVPPALFDVINPMVSSSRYARATVPGAIRRSPTNCRMEGSRCPASSSPLLMLSFDLNRRESGFPLAVS